MRELCLDTETTGLDPRSGHKIIEIAAIEMINKVRTGEFFHVYINPRRDVPQEAFNIHGISTEFLQDKPIFAHVADKFLDFIADDPVIIHNAAFDVKFLNFELNVLGRPPLNSSNIVDSLAIARKKFPGSPASLDALCKRFNIDLSRRTKHGALLDTELLCDVYIELMGGLQSKLAFANQDQSTTQDQGLASQNIKIKKRTEILPKREFPLSDQELQDHKTFMTEEFKTNFWYN